VGSRAKDKETSYARKYVEQLEYTEVCDRL